MNKTTKIASAALAVIIIIVIILAAGVGKKDTIVENDPNATSTPDVVSTTTASSTVVQAPKPQILQDNPFINQDAKFAVFLPKGWELQDMGTSSTASNTWFYDATIEGKPEVTYFVGKFTRDARMDSSVASSGPEVFLNLIAKGMSSDLNQYTLISTSTVNINGVKFQKYIGTYIGETSGKKVNQYIYLALTDKAYYVIGLDAYDNVWLANKDRLMASVSTFEFLK